MNIAINGFGRMGRLGFRAGWDHPGYTITKINELRGGPATAAHLLEYDTVHGRWDRSISHDENSLSIEGKRVEFSDAASPAAISTPIPASPTPLLEMVWSMVS